MVWRRWVEDMIYHIFYMYDIKGQIGQQKKLQAICMNELNSHPEIKDVIENDSQLTFFIIQTALESVK